MCVYPKRYLAWMLVVTLTAAQELPDLTGHWVGRVADPQGGGRISWSVNGKCPHFAGEALIEGGRLIHSKLRGGVVLDQTATGVKGVVRYRYRTLRRNDCEA